MPVHVKVIRLWQISARNALYITNSCKFFAPFNNKSNKKYKRKTSSQNQYRKVSKNHRKFGNLSKISSHSLQIEARTYKMHDHRYRSAKLSCIIYRTLYTGFGNRKEGKKKQKQKKKTRGKTHPRIDL